MKKISKVVIPAAGLGTRLLSFTKEQPKEMLPILTKNRDGELTLKPIIQVIFEQLYDCGLREFYFVVGRTKRALEDHFTPDLDFIKNLNSKNKSSQALELQSFYDKLGSSTIAWINQSSPLGFGHAVMMTKNLIGNEPFLVHAGDTLISSPNNLHIKSLLQAHNPDASHCTLLVREVDNPLPYGVIESTREQNGTLKVHNIEEKPEKPKSNVVVMPLYIFEPTIFESLKKVKPGKSGEIQLTDGIKDILSKGLGVSAIKTKKSYLWVDVGTPETYWESQYQTFKTLNR